MDNARKQLSQDCQQVLDLFFQGISMVEIAAKLGFASEGCRNDASTNTRNGLLTWCAVSRDLKNYSTTENVNCSWITRTIDDYIAGNLAPDQLSGV